MVEAIILILIGFVLLIKGADFLVNGAVGIAKKFHIPEIIIGLTIVSIGTSMPELIVSITSAVEGYSDMAIGTSLPELVTTVSAAVKKESDIAIGNILGSNIFNMLLIIGVSALIKPITYNLSYNIDMYIAMIAAFVLFLFAYIPPKNKMSRMNGIVYLMIYAIYMITLFV